MQITVSSSISVMPVSRVRVACFMIIPPSARRASPRARRSRNVWPSFDGAIAHLHPRLQRRDGQETGRLRSFIDNREHRGADRERLPADDDDASRRVHARDLAVERRVGLDSAREAGAGGTPTLVAAIAVCAATSAVSASAMDASLFIGALLETISELRSTTCGGCRTVTTIPEPSPHCPTTDSGTCSRAGSFRCHSRTARPGSS